MFMDLLNRLIRLPGENLNDVLILLLLFLALFWYLYYDLIKLGGIWKSLKGLNDKIRRIDGFDSANIQLLDELIDGTVHSCLREAWTNCYNDFRHIMNREKLPDIRNHFSQNNIITVPAGRIRAEIIPGILTAIGLLGTLLGMMSGLQQAGDVSWAEGEALRRIMGLLASSFSISIFALALSILFQLVDKQKVHIVVSELHRFTSQVSGRIPTASEMGSLESLIREEREQSMAMQQLGSDITAKLKEFIGKALIPSVHMLEKLTTAADQAQLKGGKAMADSYAVMDGVREYQDQLSGMNLTLAGSLDGLKQFNETVRQVLLSDMHIAEDLRQQRKELLEQSGQYFSRMDDQIRRLLEELAIQLDGAVSRFSDIVELSYERMDDRLQTAVEGMSDGVRSLIESMDDRVRDLNLYAKEISSEVSVLSSKLGSAVQDFSGQMQDGVTRTMVTFDDGLSEICGRLSMVIVDLKDAMEEMPVVIGAMKSS